MSDFEKVLQPMEDQYPDEEREEINTALPPMPPPRNKAPSRCFHVMMICVYLVLFILAIVALGTFGYKHTQVVNYARTFYYGSLENSCILFTTHYTRDGVGYVRLHSPRLCGYVLWGLVSIAILAFVWIINSIVQAAIGLRVVSLLRLLDLIMMLLACFFSLALSVTIEAGLNSTCDAFLASYPSYYSCEGAHLKEEKQLGLRELAFYNELKTSKTCSWLSTVTLAGLSVWYTIMVISYCYGEVRRRRYRNTFVPAGV